MIEGNRSIAGSTELRGLHLHVDAASGAAGDMMLGALIDLGVPVEVIGDALDAIGAGRARLRVARVVKHGIAAVDVKVDTTGELTGAPAHRHTAAHADHNHAPGHGAHDETAHRHTDHNHAPGHGAHDETAHRHGHRSHSEPSPGRGHHRHGEPAHGHDHEHGHDQGHDHDHEHGHDQGHDHDHGHGHDHDHDHDHEHGHDHGHGHDGSDHAHRHGDGGHVHYAAIRSVLAAAALTPGTRTRALDMFDRIARAEARLHGTTPDEVSFHEVGAIDSVVDVVGTAAALDWLTPAAVTCTSVAMGHGTLTCAHGVLPVPAPAALEILRDAGGVMADGGVARELCTPTGAAILAATVTRWTAAPAGRPVAIGWGAGDAELADRANALRVIALAPAAAPGALDDRGALADRVWQIDANLDDMSPELCGPASDAVFAAGALDVWWTPITMKKGRPALMVSALATGDTRDAVAAAILRETTTIGVRFAARERTVLARSTREVATPYGPIPVKVAVDGDRVCNAAPEFEACAAAARRHGVPVKRVFAAALAAFETER